MNLFGVRLTALAAAIVIAAGALSFSAAAETSADRKSAKSKTHVQIGGNSENDDWEFNRQAEDNQYLLLDADTYFISERSISWMDDLSLVLARNEFFARRGRKFSTKWIREYFEKQKWYHGKIEEKRFSANLFNTYEIANIKFIAAYESKRKAKGKKKVTKLRITGPNEAPDEYAGIYEQYFDAIRSKWTSKEAELTGMMWISSEEEEEISLGYTSADINGDGQEEFLIGPTDTKEYGEGAVFAIYTLENGSPVCVAQSDGSADYYICDDNLIRREESDEEGRWAAGYFRLEGSRLVCSSVLMMDESVNEEQPWFILKTEKTLKEMEADTGKKVSEKKSEKDSEKKPEKDSEKKSEKDSEKKPEKDSEKKSEKDSEKKPEKDSEKKSEKGSVSLDSLNQEDLLKIGAENFTGITTEQAGKEQVAHSGAVLDLLPFVLESK